MSDSSLHGIGIVLLVTLAIVFCVGGAWGCPKYSVWLKEMEGLGKLREAENSRQITIQEAKAKLEASKMLSEAEVERAKGVAAANKIIGDSLKENESYLRYLWITGLQDKPGEQDQKTVIYVATEAGIPILEAGRGVDKK